MPKRTTKTTVQASDFEAELNKYKSDLAEANKKIARLEDTLAQNIAVRSEPIKAKTIIAVEGKDEVDFFKVYLEFLGVEDYDVKDVVGKSNFRPKVKALVNTRDFDSVENLILIRDADNDANAAFTSLKNLIKEIGLEVPATKNSFSATGKPRVGIYIMPGAADTGMLEDLCLKIVQYPNVMLCVEEYLACVAKHGLTLPPNVVKAKFLAYLAVMPDTVTSVGVAAKRGYFDLNSSELDDIRKFLQNL
jgi:hypothetical protein